MSFSRLLFARRTWAAVGVGALLTLPPMFCRGQDAPGERDITKPPRWAVMTGTDADVARVKTPATPTTIADLLAQPRPSLLAPGTLDPSFRRHRAGRAETTEWSVDALLVGAQINDDGDYHLVMRDASGHTLTGELPDPARMGQPSRFAGGMRAARSVLVHRLHPGEKPLAVHVPIRVVGLGYWGRAGKGPGGMGNGIQLHPITGIEFR